MVYDGPEPFIGRYESCLMFNFPRISSIFQVCAFKNALNLLENCVLGDFWMLCAVTYFKNLIYPHIDPMKQDQTYKP